MLDLQVDISLLRAWKMWTRSLYLTPGDQVLSFNRAKIRNQTEYFYLCLLALWSLDDAEVEINDVLGEGDNITFTVGI